MFKKDIKTAPLHSGSSKKTDVIKHVGKGGSQGPLRPRNNFDSGMGGDYKKPTEDTSMPSPALGSGDWAGNIG